MKARSKTTKMSQPRQDIPSTTPIKQTNKNKSKKKSSKDDPRKPKKPPTAFFYFLEDFRKTFREKNPKIRTMSEIGKACGEKWRTLHFDEKVVYYDIATAKRAEFEKAMAEYLKWKENGEEPDELVGNYD